tara:strand:+ start:1055 stop:1609 length:555 start_codon:yes stop_codon:yes gene_type:complete
MLIKNLNDAIHYHQKVFDKRWCDNLVKYADLVCVNKGKTVEKKDNKSRKVFTYPFSNNKQDTLYKAWIFSRTSEILKFYLAEYKSINNLKILDVEMLKYNDGFFFKTHIDDSIKTPRTLSIIINLNDNYIGGELYFTSQDHKDITKIYELKRGDVIIFPSNFLYPHGIMPIIKGTRYSIITWLK